MSVIRFIFFQFHMLIASTISVFLNENDTAGRFNEVIKNECKLTSRKRWTFSSRSDFIFENSSPAFWDSSWHFENFEI